MLNSFIKKFFYFLFLSITIFGIVYSIFFKDSFTQAQNISKVVFFKDGGFEGKISTQAATVEKFLKEQKVVWHSEDLIYPDLNTPLVNGSHVVIQRAKHFQIFIGEEKKEGFTQQNDVLSLLQEQGIQIKAEDIVQPARNSFVYNNIKVKVILVEIKEKVIKQVLKYKTIVQEDQKLSWRKRIIKEKGKNGIKAITYKEIYHNQKKISSKKIKEEVIKKPQKEVVIQGTYIKLGKAHRGQASWYNFTGKMTAANPWLPLGSYVKVTNLANHKSVIVKIVDRGPFGKGRIIDLEKVAFAKIASLGAGVVNVKMEEIKN